MTERVISAEAVRTHAATVGTAILIRDGRIAAVGGEELCRADRPRDHFAGAVVVPGFVDAHFHPVGHAASLRRPSLKSAPDFDAVGDALAAAARSQPPGTAVTALRLDDESLAERRLPDRHVLDSILPDRPVLVMRYCGHVAIANTAGLEAAGIRPDTPDPRGGSFDRDDAGVPTGIARETAAEMLSSALRGFAPPITPEDVIDASTALAMLGITTIGGIADVRPGCWAGSGSELDTLIEAAPRLPIEMRVFVIADSAEAAVGAARRIEDAGGRLAFGGVKMFADGSLGGHTAAMHRPFSDAPSRRGTHRLDTDQAVALGRTGIELGGRLAIHAIGDAANERALDVMETLIGEGIDPACLRIEHASVLAETDIERFGRLGVTASVQPAFLASETGWLERRVGRDRIGRTYPFRSLLEAGAPLCGGSDCPVEPPHPLPAMAAARDRCGIVPEQALAPEEALALFTAWSAAAVGVSRDLEPGSPADLAVLDRDPVAASPEELRRTRVLATLIGGTLVRPRDDAIAWPD